MTRGVAINEMPLTITIPEPSSISVARAALPILRQLKQREVEWQEEREADRRRPVQERSFDWQSYCVHGTYIGDPYGGDYLCHLCEDGIGVYREAVERARVKVQRQLTAIALIYKLEDLGVLSPSSEDELRDALSIRITQRLYS